MKRPHLHQLSDILLAATCAVALISAPAQAEAGARPLSVAQPSVNPPPVFKPLRPLPEDTNTRDSATNDAVPQGTDPVLEQVTRAAFQPSGPQPTDPLATQQSYLLDIGAWAAWAAAGVWSTAGGPQPVTVAVLDTGYVATPELRGRQLNGYDFVSDAARAGDGTGRDAWAGAVGPLAYHGEMVAGLLAAAHDGAGMAGLNPSARVLQVRVAGTQGMIAVDDLIDGLRWAAGLEVAGAPRNRWPARVINASLFADWLPHNGCDPRVQQAIDEVTAAGALVVVGAGNDDRDAGALSPAGCSGVLTVTAAVPRAGGSWARADYANWGAAVGLAAPGGDAARPLVASTVLNDAGRYTALTARQHSGTSFAAPLVSGAASLLLAQYPHLSPAEVRELLVWSATPWENGCDADSRKSCGSGVLNVAAALELAGQLHPAQAAKDEADTVATGSFK